MFKFRVTYLLGLTLAINGCASSNHPQVGTTAVPANYGVSDAPMSKVGSSSSMSLRIIQRTRDNVLLELRNDSDRHTFLSYSPQQGVGQPTFVSYDLQSKNEQGDFGQSGEEFHHVPNLYPLDSRASISFRLIHYPKEKGEYRVRVSYYEDENVYRMISERLVDMTDAERRTAEQARKYVFSDSFFIPAKSDRK